MSLKLTKDDKNWQKLKSRLLSVGKKEVQVGFFEEDIYDDGTQVAQVAQWQNEGTLEGSGWIPPRPFFARALHDFEDGFLRVLTAEISNNVLSGVSTVNVGLKEIGELAVERIKQQIEAEPLSNKPSTIRKKGDLPPLIETDKMYQSVKYKIKQKSSKINF